MSVAPGQSAVVAQLHAVPLHDWPLPHAVHVEPAEQVIASTPQTQRPPVPSQLWLAPQRKHCFVPPLPQSLINVPA